ncbi:MAG: hypothetical protein LBK69_03060 [Syntrophomonadaceae bacterium]|jgi:hypothetical protein|nr:hypothetical protein [Syntrophomonadaceae bacterium]
MTRKEWVKAPKNEKRWSNYNKARKHFPLCKFGKSIVLHHLNPACTNYEEWNVDELVPMFTWCHTYLHNTKYQTERQKINFIGNRKGKKHTAEARRKLSESHRGKPWSEKRKAAYIRNGIFVSNETRAKLSIAQKGHPGHIFTEEQLKRLSKSHKGQIPPSQKGTIQSEETKKKRAESLKRFYASPEGIEKRKLFSLTRKRRGKGNRNSDKGIS